MVASYGAVGKVVLPKTPLDEYDIGGLTQVVIAGGMEPEPLREEDVDNLSDGNIELEDDDDY